jgi:DNA modification methylase
MDLNTWSPELAWWLGVTFGDGYSRHNDTHISTTLTSGDYDLVAKWIILGGGSVDKITKRYSGKCWDANIYDPRYAKWLSDKYGMNGRKDDKLEWPSDLPADLYSHFVRGLWDTDGNLTHIRPTDTRAGKLAVTFFNKGYKLVEGLVSNFPELKLKDGTMTSGPYKGYKYMKATITGPGAVIFGEKVYKDAPQHIRCDRKYNIFNTFYSWFQSSNNSCKTCGALCKRGEDFCAYHRKFNGSNPPPCECGVELIYAFNKCQKCYRRDYRGGVRDWSPAILQQLADFPVECWHDYSDSYKSEALDVLEGIFSTRKFPEYIFENPPSDLSSVTQGKLTFNQITHTISNVGWSGQPLCTSFYRHRFDAKYLEGMSIREAYADPKSLRSALKYQLDHRDPIRPKRVIKALSAKHKTPTNFAPVLARWLVDRYCPQGGTVFDPCSGYGGRLLGSLASNKNVHYIGHDIEPLTIEAGKKMCANLGTDRATLEIKALESDDPFPKSDLLMTCPPYYNREVYGEASEASAKSYETYGAWLQGWMGKLLDKAQASTKTLAICVSTFRLNNDKVEFPNDLRSLIQNKGMKIREELFWETSTFGKKASGKGRQEHIFVVDF